MSGTDKEPPLPSGSQRIDRWLWFARFLKSRTQAASLVVSGRIRVNSVRIAKASQLVRPGDVLTFPLGDHIHVIKVLGPGTRRGPAPEARTLYEDLTPPAPPEAKDGEDPSRAKGSGRPTKKDRRATDALKGWDDE